MPKDIHHTEQLGSRLDGAWITTFGFIAALLLVIAGALLAIFLGGAYSLIFGVPIVILGLALLLVIEFVIGKKSD